jgi:hypothetical protein
MGRRVVVTDLCDPCEHLELPETFAYREHVIAFDGQPAKKYLFCERCLKAYGEFLEMLQACGQPIEPVSFPPEQKRKKSPPKVPAKKQPKELESPKAEGPETAPAAEEPAKKEKPKQYIVCPLPHPQSKGGPRRIDYSGRSGHADQCHNGARTWEITWEDPDGILTHSCTAHAECVKTGQGYTSETGLMLHIRNSALVRMDESADG